MVPGYRAWLNSDSPGVVRSSPHRHFLCIGIGTTHKRYLKGTPPASLVTPVITVKHGGENGSCSMTGGEVYRGSAIPELVGHYFYADWCLGWIRSFRYDGAAAVDQRDWSSQLPAEMVSAFGHDATGELLVVDYEAGTVSRVVARR